MTSAEMIKRENAHKSIFAYSFSGALRLPQSTHTHCPLRTCQVTQKWNTG